MRDVGRCALLALALTTVLGLPSARAQEIDLGLIEAPRPALGDDPRASEAFRLIAREHRYVRARELAEEILRDDPTSFAGLCVLGMVLHRAEGNLPVALFHLKAARKSFETRYGATPGGDAPWYWHALILGELSFVAGEMGRHEEKLAYLEARDSIYEPRWPADRGWPLMRLRRYEEARMAIAEGLMLDDQPEQQATAKTALCAVEAELQHRERSYEACLDAAADDRPWSESGPTTFTNAAEAALGMLRMEEAEQLIQEGTERFSTGTVSNPWLNLTLLYLSQGRSAEALGTVREMFAWRNRQPAYIDEQNRADTETTSAIFLLVAGRPIEAARITARALERPDRTGFTSAESEQMEAASALLDHLVNRVAAELKAEEAASLPWWKGFRARFDAARYRWRAWSSGRRCAAMIADERVLLATIRPYLAGSIESPEWIEPELVAILGPGVMKAALEKARAQETLPGAEGYFWAFEAEAALYQGHEEVALRHAERALATLPAGEHMLQARVWGLTGKAALDAGQNEKAFEAFDRAMQLDPGVIRRLGIALPATFAAAGGTAAEKALDYLRSSPRFEPAGGGFRVQVEVAGDGGSACLYGPQQARLGCAQLTARGGESAEDLASRLALAFHTDVFAPRLDLTQADLRSLDGSPAAGDGRSQQRLRSVLDQVAEEGE